MATKMNGLENRVSRFACNNKKMLTNVINVLKINSLIIVQFSYNSLVKYISK